MKRFNKFRLFFALTLALLNLSVPLQASPLISTDFDKIRVDQMLRDIDKPRNASYLKVMYFGRRGYQFPYSVEDGWDDLNNAISLEKKGGKRWFLLMNLKSSAAFNLDFVDPKEGLQCYKELFSLAESEDNYEYDYVVNASIYEFVELLGSRMGRFGIYHTPEIAATTVAAWKARRSRVNTKNKFAQRVLSPRWIWALERTGIPADLEDVLSMEVFEKNKTDFEYLSVYSFLLSGKDNNKAIALLRRAEAVLPKDQDGKLDRTVALDYYKRLTALYADIKDVDGYQWAKKRREGIDNAK